MKKIAVSGVTIAAFVLYAMFYHKSSAIPVTTPVAAAKNSKPQSTSINTVASASATRIPTPTPQPGLYRDGEYIGSSVDAYYGFIQVKAIVRNGKLTDVQFLQYPNDHDESISINATAMPVLKEEAIQAQSSDVDIVSRATDSSQAFKESLASALSQAK